MMDKKLKLFFQKLVTHFSGREDIGHVYYNGVSDPSVVKINSPLNILSEEHESDLYTWLIDYLPEQTEICYYDMYKQIMKQFFDIWVNPTSEELNEFEGNMLEGFEASEKALLEKGQRMLAMDLATNDYEVVLGSELIDRLVRLYDDSLKQITLTEWLDAVDVSSLNNHQHYIVDFDFFTKPVPLTQADITERLNQNFPISEMSLYLYFDHLMVTRRGLDAKIIEEDSKLKVHYYCNIDSYLERNSCEMRETTLRKLLSDAVDPNRPFIEAVVDNYGEIYINHHMLHTEKDILDFVNMAYLIEEADREAKTFDRSEIFAHLLIQGASRNGNILWHRAHPIH